MGQIGPFGFSAGLNSSTSIFSQPPNSTYIQQGFRYYKGSIVEIPIGSNFNASHQLTGPGGTNKNFNGIFPNQLTSSTYQLLAIVDGKIYGIPNNFVPVDISGSTGYSNNGTWTLMSMATLNGITVVGDAPGNLVGHMAKWNGSGNFSLMSGDPDGIIVRTVNNFMFTVPTGSSTVYWSNVSDPTTWTNGNNITFRNGDGDHIVALSNIGTDLYIFKNNSIGRLSTLTQSVA